MAAIHEFSVQRTKRTTRFVRSTGREGEELERAQHPLPGVPGSGWGDNRQDRPGTREEPRPRLWLLPPANGRSMLPTFMIIGAMKAGTTSLHSYLSVHPEVFMSETKELHFF